MNVALQQKMNCEAPTYEILKICWEKATSTMHTAQYILKWAFQGLSWSSKVIVTFTTVGRLDSCRSSETA